MQPNSHKYLSKQVEPQCCSYSNNLSINVSRSMGSSGTWIGCGCIDKTGVGDNHTKVQFPFYSLVYVVRGNGTYIDEAGRDYTLKAGSLFQRRPGRVHTTSVAPECDWLEYYFDCDTAYFKHLCEIGVLDENAAVYQLQPNPTLSSEFDTLIDEIANTEEKRLADTLLHFLGCIRNLVNQGNLSTEADDSSKMIEKACLDFNHFIYKRVDIRDYCKANGFGYESFRKEFKKTTGISPGKYLVRKRLDQACQMLRSTSKSISEISILLGYKSQYEFSNQFKKYFGVFPKHFRGQKFSSSP